MMIRINKQGLILIVLVMIISFTAGWNIKSSDRQIQSSNSNLSNEDLLIRACLTPIKGEGIIIRMNDSTKNVKLGEDTNLYIIHDDDILKVVNELRAAGAEAISINDQRLTDRSEIRCAGPTLSVNNVRSSAPFEIKATGDKNILLNAIKMRGGVEDTLNVWGIQLDIETSDNLRISAFNGIQTYDHSFATD